MAGADEFVGIRVPVDTAAQVRAAAGKDQDILRVSRTADDEPAKAGAGSLPTVDLGAGELQRGGLIDGECIELTDRYTGFLCASAQGRINQVINDGCADRNGDDPADDAGRGFHEVPAAEVVRT